MKQVKLFIYNYGIRSIADFKNNYHDAVQCMKCLNDSLIQSHGKLPESIFYFITYKIKSHGRTVYYVDSTANIDLYELDKRIVKITDFIPA